MAQADVDALAILVAELQTELNRADRVVAAELGVGGSEDLQILRLLLSAGPLRVTDLARRRLSSLATASARLDRLEKRGLVVRERIPDDRRAVVVRLTDRGQDSAVESRAVRLAALEPIAAGFPTDDLRLLIDALSPADDQPPAPNPKSSRAR
jgi:DNA-binding MarR family transcriptional regulator